MSAFSLKLLLKQNKIPPNSIRVDTMRLTKTSPHFSPILIYYLMTICCIQSFTSHPKIKISNPLVNS